MGKYRSEISDNKAISHMVSCEMAAGILKKNPPYRTSPCQSRRGREAKGPRVFYLF